MQPKPKPEPKVSLLAPLEEDEPSPAAQVRVDLDPPTAARAEAPAPKSLGVTDPLGVLGVCFGVPWVLLGFLFLAGALNLWLDRYWPNVDDAASFAFIGFFVGVLPGLLSTRLGLRRLRTHSRLRRLVAVARGNDHLDIKILGPLLQVDEKTARELAVEALARRLIDARYDAPSDRLVMRAARSPFR